MMAMTGNNAPLAWALAAALVTGMALGAMFFGGLRWTLARALGTRQAQASMLIALSMLARTALALAGFWLAGGGDWRRLLACLAGFACARGVFVLWAPVRTDARGRGR